MLKIRLTRLTAEHALMLSFHFDLHQNDDAPIVYNRWGLFTPSVPPGWTPLGTVVDGRLETGALVRNDQTGLYAQCNGCVIRSLPQREIIQALANE